MHSSTAGTAVAHSRSLALAVLLVGQVVLAKGEVHLPQLSVVDSDGRSTFRLSAFANATADWRLSNDLPYWKGCRERDSP